MISFEILFDNAGGALFQAARYCHHYDDGVDLARDVIALLAGARTSDWEEDQPGFRREADDSDRAVHSSTVLAVLRGDIQPPSTPGYTETMFWQSIVHQRPGGER